MSLEDLRTGYGVKMCGIITVEKRLFPFEAVASSVRILL